MVKVERGNVVLRVKEEELKHYIDKGFNQIDDNGNVIQKAVPKDINLLQKAYVENEAVVEKLKARIAELEAELNGVKSNKVVKPEVEEKVEEPVVDENNIEIKKAKKAKK